MPVVYLTRRATFSASHRLHSPLLSEAENLSIFGKCNNPNGHGHNYEIEVKVRGEVDERSGIVMNLSDLKQAIESTVMKQLDHKNLNLDVAWFADRNPTAENIAVYCWNVLRPCLPDGALYEVRIRETENNVVTYRGGEEWGEP